MYLACSHHRKSKNVLFINLLRYGILRARYFWLRQQHIKLVSDIRKESDFDLIWDYRLIIGVKMAATFS